MRKYEILDDDSRVKSRFFDSDWLPFYTFLIIVLGIVFHIAHFPFNGILIIGGSLLLLSVSVTKLVKGNRSGINFFWLILSIILVVLCLLYFFSLPAAQ